jgi:uncharacterized protein (TIGR03435 family)
MLQSLLADRFGLALHRESREMPVYFLTAAKGGLKLASAEGSCVKPDPNMPPAGRKLPFCGSVRSGPAGMDAWKINIKTLASNLSGALGRSVIDKTIFQGTFDVHLEFARDQVGTHPPETDSGAPSLFTAVQEQLGLKLESGKAPVEVLVIDHVEKPSEN